MSGLWASVIRRLIPSSPLMRYVDKARWLSATKAVAMTPPQRPTTIHEVPGVLTPALGIPVEPRRAGGLGVLDPRPLLHPFIASTHVLVSTVCGGNQRGVGYGLSLKTCLYP